MAPKKDSSPKVRVQPVPEKRGYEFGGPYVWPPLCELLDYMLTFFVFEQSRGYRDYLWPAGLDLCVHVRLQ